MAGLTAEARPRPNVRVVHRGRQARNQSSRDFYKVVHRIARRMQPQLAGAFLKSFRQLQGRMDLGAIASALGGGNLPDVEAAVLSNRIGSLLSGSGLGDVMLNTSTLTGSAGADLIEEITGAAFRFNARDPNTVLAARTMTANLIVQVSDTTKETVRIITAAGADLGITVDDQARLIREVVGLPPNWARAPANMAEELRAGHSSVLRRRWSAADKAQIRSRFKAGTVDDAFVAKMRKRYAESLTNRRALNIARTETLRAANLGQREGWRQALEQKVLPTTARRVWLVTPDDRLRETHAAVPEMNPDGVELEGGVYETPLGPVDGPPLETNCRCSEGLIFPETVKGLDEATAGTDVDALASIGDPGAARATLDAWAQQQVGPGKPARPSAVRAGGYRNLDRSTGTSALSSKDPSVGHITRGEAAHRRLAVERYPASIPEKDVVSALEAFGVTPGATRAESVEKLVNRVGGGWNTTSADSSPQAVAFQMAARAELGLKQTTMAGVHPDIIAAAEALMEKAETALRGVVRSFKAAAQAHLDDLGLDRLPVARGMVHEDLARLAANGPVRQTVARRPLSSHSLSMKEAALFSESGRDGVLLVEVVGKDRVVGLGGSGIGTFTEMEVVVAGHEASTIVLNTQAVRAYWHNTLSAAARATWQSRYDDWAQVAAYLDGNPIQ